MNDYEKKDKCFDIVNYTFAIIVCFLMLYPLWFVVIASFSDGAALLRGDVSFLPIGFNFENYKMLFGYKMIPQAYINTLLYLVLGSATSMLLTVFAAYPLSRKEFKIRNGMAFYVAFTMLFNGGIIPTYIVVQGIGIIDSMFAMFLPIALNGFNIIVLRTFIQSVSEEILEAARIDGCGHFLILFLIVVPCAVTGMITILLFYMVGYWNSFMPGILYVLTRQDLLPMQNILRKFVIQEQSMGEATNDMNIAKGVRYAMIMITILPIISVYPFLQKYFSKGLMIGGVKG